MSKLLRNLYCMLHACFQEQMSHFNKPFVLTGDYNINLSKQNLDNKVVDYLNTLFWLYIFVK